jgi:hypothetical protein
MESAQQKAQFMLWYVEFNSIVTIQTHFLRTYLPEGPTGKSVTTPLNQFKETGNVEKRKTEPSRTLEEILEDFRLS